MLTKAWTKLRYHAKQSAAWRSTKRFVNLACGRGSGKTELARRRIVAYLQVKKPWPDPIYFYALPTYQQAKRVAWKQIKALTPPEWTRHGKLVNESDMTISTVFGSTLYVLGADKPMRAEEVQWDAVVSGSVSKYRCNEPITIPRSAVVSLNRLC